MISSFFLWKSDFSRSVSTINLRSVSVDMWLLGGAAKENELKLNLLQKNLKTVTVLFLKLCV